MKWLKAQYKRFKYVIWGIGGVLTAILLVVLKGAIVGKPGKRKISMPEVPQALKEKVEKAEEHALVARIEARVEAEKDIEKLEEVAKIDDGAERRKRLAGMLEDL